MPKDDAPDGMFSKIESLPAYVRVAEAIENEIVAGRIVPGQRIGTEATLCQQFGVNRSTVREGIRLLEQSGLIRRDQSRRLYASLPRYNNLATRLSRALVLHQATFREVWDAALVLETATAEAAARNVTADQIQRLRDNLARTRQDIGDLEKSAERDLEFHAKIGEIAGNKVLSLARQPASILFAATTRIIMAKVQVAATRNLEAHEKIADAVENNDVEMARLWMQRHMKDWGRGMEQAGLDIDAPVGRTLLDKS